MSVAWPTRPSPSAWLSGRIGNLTKRYLVLATLAYESFQRGEREDAAFVAHGLRLNWDSGSQDLAKKFPALWAALDRDLACFVDAVAFSDDPDPAWVEDAYQALASEVRRVERHVTPLVPT